MKAAWLLVQVAGCGSSNTGGMCQVDSDCGGEVCARTNECLPASQIRMVKVTWTIRGMAASAQTCAASPSFYIQFDGRSVQDTAAYAPVPCDQGQFSVDKLPRRFDQVEMGVEGRVHDIAIIDPTSGTATFNLAP